MRTRDFRRGGFGFTLIELLVVIVIIGVLAAFLLPAISRAQWTARKSKCMNNLHQFALALQTYANSNDGQPPPWLSNLYPNVVSNEKVFLCPEDPTGGKDGGKPYWENDPTKAYLETDDFDGSQADTVDPDAAAVQNHDIKRNSYLFEFCCAECSWYDPTYSWNGQTASLEEVDGIYETIHPSGGTGVVTWREIKEWEVKRVGDWTPIVRCFWHTGGTFFQEDMVLNLGTRTHHIYTSGTGGDDWKYAGNR